MSIESFFREGRQWVRFRNASHRAHRHGHLQQHRNMQYRRKQRNDRIDCICRHANRSGQHLASHLKKRACKGQGMGQNRRRLHTHMALKRLCDSARKAIVQMLEDRHTQQKVLLVPLAPRSVPGVNTLNEGQLPQRVAPSCQVLACTTYDHRV